MLFGFLSGIGRFENGNERVAIYHSLLVYVAACPLQTHYPRFIKCPKCYFPPAKKKTQTMLSLINTKTAMVFSVQTNSFIRFTKLLVTGKFTDIFHKPDAITSIFVSLPLAVWTWGELVGRVQVSCCHCWLYCITAIVQAIPDVMNGNTTLNALWYILYIVRSIHSTYEQITRHWTRHFSSAIRMSAIIIF